MKVALDNKNGRVGSTAKERFAQAHHASRNLSAVALCNNNFFRVWMGARLSTQVTIPIVQVLLCICTNERLNKDESKAQEWHHL